MKTKNIMLFAYDFPHKKTQDFLFRLITEGYDINYCLAAPWQKLNIRKSKIKIDQRHTSIIHPRLICQQFGIKYVSLEHNRKKIIDFINKNPVDLYIISGARILSKEVIKVCGGKILNIHPGFLPDIRGLDTFLWTIHYKKPLGISAHFITPKIDNGLLIYREKLPLYKADTIQDISLRLLESQPDVLIKTLDILKKKELEDLENLAEDKSLYNTRMDGNLEKQTIKYFQNWLKLFADE